MINNERSVISEQFLLTNIYKYSINQMTYKCNLIIPGFPKSGTSSLHSYLGLHDLICMSGRKEPHFFNRDSEYKVGASIHNQIFRDDVNSSFRYYGEASTTYCISELACRRIAASLDDTKIILLMREPVSRALSHYKWLCALGFENLPLSEALKLHGYNFKFENRWGGNFKSYIQFSEYHKYAPMWQECFGEGNVLFLNSEDLSRNPEETLMLVWDFLKLPPISLREKIESNRTSEIKVENYPLWMYRLAKVIPPIVKKNLTSSNVVMGFLNKGFYKSVKSDSYIDERGVELLNELLENDINYYRKVFSHL